MLAAVIETDRTAVDQPSESTTRCCRQFARSRRSPAFGVEHAFEVEHGVLDDGDRPSRDAT